jgi:hypothetical protein
MIFSRTFIFSVIPCIVGVFGVGFQPNYANAAIAIILSKNLTVLILLLLNTLMLLEAKKN